MFASKSVINLSVCVLLLPPLIHFDTKLHFIIAIYLCICFWVFLLHSDNDNDDDDDDFANILTLESMQSKVIITFVDVFISSLCRFGEIIALAKTKTKTKKKQTH